MKRLYLACLLAMTATSVAAQVPDVPECVFGKTVSSIRSRTHVGVPAGTAVIPMSIFRNHGTVCVLSDNMHGYVLPNKINPRQPYVVLTNGMYVYTPSMESLAKK